MRDRAEAGEVEQPIQRAGRRSEEHLPAWGPGETPGGLAGGTPTLLLTVGITGRDLLVDVPPTCNPLRGRPHCPVQASEKQPSVFVVHCLVQGENVFTRMIWLRGENSISRMNPLPPFV